MGLFGKTQKKPPKELVNEWSLKIKKEMRVSMNDAAKKGQKDVCMVLAKEMIQLCEWLVLLQKSTEVMKAMQHLVKILEIQAIMRELSEEMMKAGIIEKMLEDTFESAGNQEEMQEAAAIEIDRILFDITIGALGKRPSKVTDALPEPTPPGAMAA
ncbi:hypothetical protein FD754_019272 [Muntiacus muntjak]|uniref:Charged multivesicular body protein 3 n=1 Tax=Muntiacus muntjak TaxID=9888 RepID=A0A5N3UZP3_MUNMU|nr:hypothetical protein FD754_019272 [Muntiacus muntjak]